MRILKIWNVRSWHWNYSENIFLITSVYKCKHYFHYVYYCFYYYCFLGMWKLSKLHLYTQKQYCICGPYSCPHSVVSGPGFWVLSGPDVPPLSGSGHSMRGPDWSWSSGDLGSASSELCPRTVVVPSQPGTMSLCLGSAPAVTVYPVLMVPSLYKER